MIAVCAKCKTQVRTLEARPLPPVDPDDPWTEEHQSGVCGKGHKSQWHVREWTRGLPGPLPNLKFCPGDRKCEHYTCDADPPERVPYRDRRRAEPGSGRQTRRTVVSRRSVTRRGR